MALNKVFKHLLGSNDFPIWTIIQKYIIDNDFLLDVPILYYVMFGT